MFLWQKKHFWQARQREGQDKMSGVGCFGPPYLTVKNAGKQYIYIYMSITPHSRNENTASEHNHVAAS